MTPRPRDYQDRMIESCELAWERYDSILAKMPTGTGKTICFVELATRHADGRVLVICPQIELIDQAARKIYHRTGEEAAIEQGQRWSNESSWASAPIVVASKQSLTSNFTDRYGVRQKRYTRIKGVSLVIVDEAHWGVSEAMQEILQHYQKQGAKVLGVTATSERADGKALRNLYEHCAYQYELTDAIRDGWLVSPVTHCVQLKHLDLSQIKASTKGDFSDKAISRLMEDEKVLYEIAEITAAESRGLKTVVYTARVAEARAVANLLADQHGYKAEWICGDQRCSDDKRSRVLRSFASDPDGVSIICNCGVLTTGWDCPELEHIVMARPTKSLSLYTQILGRGTRPAAGVVDFEGSTPESRKAAIAASVKPHFKVTDLRDNSLQHKLVSCVDVLGGEMGLEAKARAKEILEQADEAQPLADVLAEATAAQIEAERLERERLARVAARADYHRVKVDPFDESQVGRVASDRQPGKPIRFGKYKGQPIADVPADYLRFIAGKDKYPQWMRGPCWAELKRRAGNRTAQSAQRTRPAKSTTSAAAVAAKLQKMLLEV